MYVLRQTTCMVLYPIMVDKQASFFNCTTVGRGIFCELNIRLLFGAALELKARFRVNKTGLWSPPNCENCVYAEHSQAVPLLQLFYFCASSVSYVLFVCSIMKTYLYNFEPLKHYFYIVKLGFSWVCTIFSYFCSKT